MKKQPSLMAIMTPFPYSVKLTTPLQTAKDSMEEHNVRHLPVTEHRNIVGIVTDRDIKQAIELSDEQVDLSILTVQDVYVSNPYVVDIQEPLDNVLLTMAERHLGSVIVTKHGNLAGVFTTVDACRCFGQYLREHFPRDDDNDAA